MSNYLVSVIVPVYNVEQYLKECLNSIVDQIYNNIEIILVDDGSLDNSRIICDEYAQKDERIKVVHKKNGGLSSARNVGLDLATGDFITFCDSDDVILPLTILRYVELQKQYNCDVVSSESLFYKNGVKSIIKHYHKDERITLFTGEEFITGFFDYTTDCSVCNKLFRKDVIGENRFEEGKTNEDLLFQYEVLKNKSIVHTNEALYLYTVNESGITHTFNTNSLNAYYNAVILHNKVQKDYPELRGKALYYTIIVGYNLGMQIKRADLSKRGVFKKAYSDIRKYIWETFCDIIKSPLFSFSFKLRFFYLMLGAPFSKIIKR